MLDLKVTIDEQSGFCFGVVYAIEVAESYLESQGYLYCLGDIVHNDREVERLTAMGLRIISHEDLKALRDETVLIRAHGEAPLTYQLAFENNITLIDASCPVVLKLQNRVRDSYDRGDHIAIYGKPNHAEVIGLNGQTNNQATLIPSVSALDPASMPEEITLFSQTTKNVQDFYALKSELESHGKKVRAYDTICRQVSNRDVQLRDFALRFDKVIFVAGSKSSNGKMLFQVCKAANPDSHFISSSEEIDPSWFKPSETVGVCGATSTPMWLMEEVKKHISAI
jgi:4-hydroxy-3-methylbut-2-enyl diphosphate reductase